MRVKLITLRFAPSLGGFDDRPLADFVRDKEVLAVREHFFAVHDLPHLACLVTYQEAALAATAEDSSIDRPQKRRRPDPTADLDEAERVLFGTLREWRNARARKEAGPELLVLARMEEFTGWLLDRTAKWPKSARFTLTQRIENAALDIVEDLVAARYQPRGRRQRLDDVNLRLERMRHLFRLAKGARVCPFNVFESSMRSLDEVGRMLHGWRTSVGGNRS